MALADRVDGRDAARLGSAPGRARQRLPEIKPGDRFRRVHPDQTVETALVLAIQQGPIGIPHVRFSVHFERSRFSFFDDGPRTLALAIFADHYRDRVTAAR